MNLKPILVIHCKLVAEACEENVDISKGKVKCIPALYSNIDGNFTSDIGYRNIYPYCIKLFNVSHFGPLNKRSQDFTGLQIEQLF